MKGVWTAVHDTALAARRECASVLYSFDREGKAVSCHRSPRRLEFAGEHAGGFFADGWVGIVLGGPTEPILHAGLSGKII